MGGEGVGIGGIKVGIIPIHPSVGVFFSVVK